MDGRAHQYDNREDAERGSEGDMQAIQRTDENGKRPVLPGAKAEAGNDVQNSQDHRPNPKYKPEPLEKGEEFLRWEWLLLVLPHLRVIEKCMEHRKLRNHDEDGDQCEAHRNEVKYREQDKVVGIDGALAIGNGGNRVIHKPDCAD